MCNDTTYDSDTISAILVFVGKTFCLIFTKEGSVSL